MFSHEVCKVSCKYWFINILIPMTKTFRNLLGDAMAVVEAEIAGMLLCALQICCSSKLEALNILCHLKWCRRTSAGPLATFRRPSWSRNGGSSYSNHLKIDTHNDSRLVNYVSSLQLQEPTKTVLKAFSTTSRDLLEAATVASVVQIIWSFAKRVILCSSSMCQSYKPGGPSRTAVKLQEGRQSVLEGLQRALGEVMLLKACDIEDEHIITTQSKIHTIWVTRTAIAASRRLCWRPSKVFLKAQEVEITGNWSTAYLHFVCQNLNIFDHYSHNCVSISILLDLSSLRTSLKVFVKKISRMSYIKM